MTNVNLAAKLSQRELAIAAYTAGMTDASIAEVGKYAILRLAGYGHDEAKEKALSRRGGFTIESSDMTVGIRMPEDWLDEARKNVPDNEANTSYVLRYALVRLTTSEDEAHILAARPHTGRPKGSKNKAKVSA